MLTILEYIWHKKLHIFHPNLGARAFFFFGGGNSVPKAPIELRMLICCGLPLALPFVFLSTPYPMFLSIIPLSFIDILFVLSGAPTTIILPELDLFIILCIIYCMCPMLPILLYRNCNTSIRKNYCKTLPNPNRRK